MFNPLKKYVYIFEHPVSYITIVNNFDKIVFSAIALILIICTAKDLIFKGLIISLLSLALYLPISAHLGKCSYKIEFNSKLRKARFYLLRNKGIKNVDFNEIKKVRICSTIVFCFKDHRVMYNDVGNKTLIEYLEKEFDIHSGLLGRLSQKL